MTTKTGPDFSTGDSTHRSPAVATALPTCRWSRHSTDRQGLGEASHGTAWTSATASFDGSRDRCGSLCECETSSAGERQRNASAHGHTRYPPTVTGRFFHTFLRGTVITEAHASSTQVNEPNETSAQPNWRRRWKTPATVHVPRAEVTANVPAFSQPRASAAVGVPARVVRNVPVTQLADAARRLC